jgi:hypothetical protein
MQTADHQLLELLGRWQRGDFRRQDEEALQRLLDAEPDDFRRDAVEGFLSAPEADHERHLEALRFRLNGQVSATVAPPAPKRYVREWVAIAAVMTGLAVAIGWVVSQHKDTSAIAGGNMPFVIIPGPGGLGSRSAPVVVPVPVPDPQPVPTPPSAPKTDSIAEAPAPIASTTGRDNSSGNAANSGVAVVTPTQPSVLSTESAATPPSGDLSAMDSEAIRPDVNAKPSAKRLPNPMRNSDQVPLGEEKSKIKTEEDAARPKTQPKDGWEDWNIKIKEKAILPPAAQKAGVKGSVRMLVDLTANGTIKRIGFINTLGYGCDEIAEQLVRTTNWRVPSGGNLQMILEVPFRSNTGN